SPVLHRQTLTGDGPLGFAPLVPRRKEVAGGGLEAAQEGAFRHISRPWWQNGVEAQTALVHRLAPALHHSATCHQRVCAPPPAPELPLTYLNLLSSLHPLLILRRSHLGEWRLGTVTKPVSQAFQPDRLNKNVRLESLSYGGLKPLLNPNNAYPPLE